MKENWNFEWWKTKHGESETKLALMGHDPEFELLYGYLDDCHDILAHKGLDPFQDEIYSLIKLMYGVLVREDTEVYPKEGKRDLLKEYPVLRNYLERLGYFPYDKSNWMWGRSGQM